MKSVDTLKYALKDNSNFTKDWIKNINTLENDIENNDILIITGDPGIGKTTLAFWLEAHLPNSILQIINKEFYFNEIQNNLRNELNQLWRQNKYISWSTNRLISDRLQKSNNIKYLIIDEFQRSWTTNINDRYNEDEFTTICKICKEKKIKMILIGDYAQYISFYENPNVVENILTKYNLKIKQVKYSDYCTYKYAKLNYDSNDEIKYLLTNKNLPKQKSNLEIYILDTEADLLKAIKQNNQTELYLNFYNYYKLQNKKEVYLVYSLYDLKDNKSNFDEYKELSTNLVLLNENRNEYYPFDKEDYENDFKHYILFPHQAVSRIFDYMFIYLPGSWNIEDIKDLELANYKSNPDKEKARNAGNIYELATRATKKLFIFSSNKKTKQILKERLLDLQKLNSNN